MLLPPADALGGEGKTLACRFMICAAFGGDPRAGCAQRVADRDAAAVDVHFLHRDPEFADRGDRLRSECLVDLHHVDLLAVVSPARSSAFKSTRAPGPMPMISGARPRWRPSGCGPSSVETVPPRMRLRDVMRVPHRRAIGQRRRRPRRHWIHPAGTQASGPASPSSVRRRPQRAILVDTAIGRLHGYDLIAQPAFALRLRRPSSARRRPASLIGARDIELPRHILRRLAHRDVRPPASHQGRSGLCP